MNTSAVLQGVLSDVLRSYEWPLADGSGLKPSLGALLLSWSSDTSNDLIRWDDDNGNPQYLEWTV